VEDEGEDEGEGEGEGEGETAVRKRPPVGVWRGEVWRGEVWRREGSHIWSTIRGERTEGCACRVICGNTSGTRVVDYARRVMSIEDEAYRFMTIVPCLADDFRCALAFRTS